MLKNMRGPAKRKSFVIAKSTSGQTRIDKTQKISREDFPKNPKPKRGGSTTSKSSSGRTHGGKSGKY